jgi:multidrug efflux pump subunit AcrA (membrane-fusion protein)
MNKIGHTGLGLLLVLAIPQALAADAIKVNIAPFSEIATYPLRSAPATVVSLNATGIAAEIPAKIIEFKPRVGDIVEKDQELVRLKCIDYEIEQQGAKARLESLDARIELAKRRLERTRKLTMKNYWMKENRIWLY